VKVAHASRAGALLVSGKLKAEFAQPHLIAEFPLAALNRVIEALGLLPPPPPPGIHPTAIVDKRARLGADAHVGPYAVIGAATIGARAVIGPGVVIEDDVVVGDDCVLQPGAVLHDGCRLGHRVRVGAHAVLSRPGFGYAPGPQGPVRLHHVGRVVLEDDVHIGAGAAVDRARFDDTRIGRFTAVDNLVHVGHNCRVGERSFLAAQTGLAGNAAIGDDCEIGGQVGIANHCGVGNRSRVGAQSGVITMFGDGVELFGYPAAPKREFLRQVSALRKLGGKK